MENQVLSRLVKIFLITYAAGVAAFIIVNEYQSFHLFSVPDAQEIISASRNRLDMKRFKSEKDFKEYIAKSSGSSMYGRSISTMEALGGQTDSSSAKALSGQIERSGSTNVQVAEIDEPDIVKVGNGNIYISKENVYGIFMERMPLDKIIPPRPIETETNIIKAFPIDEMEKSGVIKKNGNLLLNGSTLAIFANDGIYGYDVASSSDPEEKWKIEYKDSVLAGARKYDGKIYAITKQYINSDRPCPVEPLISKEAPVTVACNQIYHPVAPTQAESVYTALIINPLDGRIEKSLSFVGSEQGTVLYMSPLNIYLGYSVETDRFAMLADFLKTASDILPASIIDKIKKLEGYDLSGNTKSMELETALYQYINSLSDKDRKKIDAGLNEKFNRYIGEYKRELEKTDIVKIGLGDFKVEKTASVPGRLLNQFSLDEYGGNLRVVTTIGQSGWWGFGQIQNQSTNDLYVLNKDLGVVGSIKDFGLEERVYSVRFIEDKGYVVTFKQVDPFFVMDLSNPQAPQIKGELKIPGFSSYLHPLSKDEIVGIGREEDKVKISLFNVANAEKPEEVSKYSLDEYWSEVFNNYHAFFMDKKHKIFFMPGDNGGHIFSYDGGKISLVKEIEGFRPVRATYINDYFYLVGEEDILVLDENNWGEVKRLKLN